MAMHSLVWGLCWQWIVNGRKRMFRTPLSSDVDIAQRQGKSGQEARVCRCTQDTPLAHQQAGAVRALAEPVDPRNVLARSQPGQCRCSVIDDGMALGRAGCPCAAASCSAAGFVRPRAFSALAASAAGSRRPMCIAGAPAPGPGRRPRAAARRSSACRGSRSWRRQGPAHRRPRCPACLGLPATPRRQPQERHSQPGATSAVPTASLRSAPGRGARHFAPECGAPPGAAPRAW